MALYGNKIYQLNCVLLLVSYIPAQIHPHWWWISTQLLDGEGNVRSDRIRGRSYIVVSTEDILATLGRMQLAD